MQDTLRGLSMNLLRNLFVQTVGVVACIYLILLGLNWAILFALRTLETFSRWYRYQAAPYSLQIALGLGLAYLVVMGILSSREN